MTRPVWFLLTRQPITCTDTVSPSDSHTLGTALPSHSVWLTGCSQTSIHFSKIGAVSVAGVQKLTDDWFLWRQRSARGTFTVLSCTGYARPLKQCTQAFVACVTYRSITVDSGAIHEPLV